METRNFTESNSEALRLLSQGKFAEAQALFFKNAKKYKSHEAYNNLGVYLCSEGLECRNGKVRNADKLGLFYLQKAEQSKKTDVNAAYIAYELYRQNEYAFRKTGADLPEILQLAIAHLDTAMMLTPSDEAMYNRLVCAFLLDPSDPTVLIGMNKIVSTLQDEDGMEFWVQVLCFHKKWDECREVLRTFGDRLDEVCKMIAWYRCGEYKIAAEYFPMICKKFFLSEIETAYLVDCLAKAFGRDEWMAYKKPLMDAQSPENPQEIKRYAAFVNNMFESEMFRYELITKDRFRPSYIIPCGYFGCKIHHIQTNEDIR